MAKAKDTRPTAPAKAEIKVNTRTEKVDENDRAKNRTTTDIKEPLTVPVSDERESRGGMTIEDNRSTKVVTQTKVIDNTDAPARAARKAPKAKTVKHPGRATEVLYV